jgi:hypothetical protein
MGPGNTVRSSWVYIAMTVIVAIGLWIILGYGTRRLQAPPDISGQWVVVDDDSDDAGEVRIIQSGLYLRVHWPQRGAVGLRMDEISPDRLHLTLVNGDEQYSVQLTEDRSQAQWIHEPTDTLWLLQRVAPSGVRGHVR